MKTDREAALVALDDYVRGHGGEDTATYEDDLFERALAGAAPELAFRQALGKTFHAMKQNGSLELWVTEKGIEALLAAGLRILRLDWTTSGPPESMPDLATADVDLLVTKVPIDLQGAKRLDVEVYDLDGRLLKTMPEVDFDPADGCVYACCDIELARLASGSRTVSRVWMTDANGKRSVVAELPT